VSDAAKKPSPFRRRDTGIEKEIDVGLPPTAAQPATKRKSAKALDLSGIPPTWLLIGGGRAGKTTFARWSADRAYANGRDLMLAAVDPAQRTLAGFFEGVEQPDSSDPTHAAKWLGEALGSVMESPTPLLIDLGGGDLSLANLLDLMPDLAQAMEGAGAAPVAAYFLSTRVDDLAALRTYEERGFQPKSTVLVLNEAHVGQGEDADEAFSAVTQHSRFRAAVGRGAIVIRMPRLVSDGVVREIERKRMLFTEARDGRVPEGSKASPLGLFDRTLVRRWMDQMEAAFAPIGTWLP
jgi:hypothetical protein